MEEKNYKKGKENFVDNGYVFYLGSGNRFMDIYIYIYLQTYNCTL